MVSEKKVKVEVRKPKTKKGRLALKAREPKEEETLKTALLIYGPRTSQLLKDVMTDVGKLKWNECTRYTQLHPDLRPFEAGGELALQNYCSKLDAGLFVVGSHTKKRPHNLVVGRMFDGQILDMVELGVDAYKALKDFRSPGGVAGAKAMFAFVGEKFNTVPELKCLKSIFLDFFRGQVVSNVVARGLDRVILIVAISDKKVFFRHYESCRPKNERDGKGLNVRLAENGPRLNLCVRRHRAAPEDLEAEALKQRPAKKKEKNVKSDKVDGKVGKVYVPKQDIDSIVLSKPKGVKRQKMQLQSPGTKRQKD